MHEAGIAAGIVQVVIRNGLAGRSLRLVVTGGQTDPASFDAALLAHLHAHPLWTASAVEIVHAASEAMCSGCAGRFLASPDRPRCPACGAVPLHNSRAERIEIQVDAAVREGGD